MICHPCCWYPRMISSHRAANPSACWNFLGRLRAGRRSWGGDLVDETATRGCCRTVPSLMDSRAFISSVISSVGRMGDGCSSHPRNTFSHNAWNWSHVGRPMCWFSLCMHRCDHAALTMDHSVTPSGVVRDRIGFSQRMSVGSDTGPSGVAAGPRHWVAMWAATETYLHPATACCEVSWTPQMGHAVSCGCQLASLTPTDSFFHRAVCMNCLSGGGSSSLCHAFQTSGFCLGGSGVCAMRKRSMALLFQFNQKVGLASSGVEGLGRGRARRSSKPATYTGSQVRGR
mmetsp:Transcript_1973/g.3678  ORF Transcript_1973/g.3678 Transcript_1973/m.3678 type:complete len:286 (+) Transcript_1973:1532-2389(+)